jgi:hypothetical protein
LTLPSGTNLEVLYGLRIASTAPDPGLTGSTTLGGFSLIGNINDFGESPTEGPFYANVSMISNGALALFSLYGLNSFTWSHATNPDWDVMQYSDYVWRDSIPDILDAYHDIMFQLGLSAAAKATLVGRIVLGSKTYTSARSVSATYVSMRTTMSQSIDTSEAPWPWSCWQFSALCQPKFLSIDLAC